MAFPTTEAWIALAEEELGCELPPALRHRLLRENGGEVYCHGGDFQLHPVADRSDRRRLSRSANDIVRETRAARELRGFPSEGIAVGYDGTGSILLFIPGSDELARWDHETGRSSTLEIDFG